MPNLSKGWAFAAVERPNGGPSYVRKDQPPDPKPNRVGSDIQRRSVTAGAMMPLGLEDEPARQERKELLRRIGYKL